MSVNFDTIKAAALSSIESVLQRWAPGGKRHGREYQPLNPRRSDGKPGSFSINLDSSAWSDFATGDKGGDLIALVAYIDNVKQSEAAKRLAEFLGLSSEKSGLPKRSTSPRNGAADTQAPTQSKTPAWRAILPVPVDAPQPHKTHLKHGKPSMRWEYRDKEGGLLCLVYRFDPKQSDECKQFCPLTYCEDPNGKREWRWQGLPEPRPLYHLDQLAARHDAPVVVCEGEKAADAAALLFPDAVATTMLNGAQSTHKSDWQPLKGRTVYLWPDNDEAGRACMVSVASLLAKAGADNVQQVNLAAFARTPAADAEGCPILNEGTPPDEKWDAADAVNEGWTAEHVNLLRQASDFLQDAKPINKGKPDKAATSDVMCRRLQSLKPLKPVSIATIKASGTSAKMTLAPMRRRCGYAQNWK